MNANISTLIADRFQIPSFNPNGEHFIGQGGMGAVYAGLDRQTNEKVAVKILKSEFLARDPDMIHRFQREGEALRRLNHPNIVKILAMVEENNTHYLVMEFVGGGSLRDVLTKKHRLSVQQTLYIALDLADALTRAHRLDILHRDIKPDNVLLADDGTPRLTDFGMARMGDSRITQDGAVIGTLAYMSPETFSENIADERTDIWSFGVMLYEMLTGERPFNQEMPGMLINAILTQPIPDLETLRPDIPTALVDLIYRMLAKERNARIPSVRQIGAELETIIRGDTSTIQAVKVDTDDPGRFETPEPKPVSTSQRIAPHNLPAQPTPFVGRDDEIKALQQFLDDPNTRLITLLGPGGMGKTRLAVAVAEQQLKKYGDGVFFVPLAPLTDVSQIPAAMATAFDFAFGGGDPKTEVINYLREKSVLLILDNFEHVINGAGIVSDILQHASHVKVLATSRELLRLRGEQVFDVMGMKVPGKWANSPEQLEELPVVKLFMLSAHRVVPDFELNDATAPHVAEIIRRVQGLPLGIELAATWLEMLPVDEICNELERSFDFLETDLRDVPERHRSFRAVFEYSWNLMAPEEQEAFLKLTVFQGGFEREAAQNVANASLRTLTGLVNKSFLTRDPNGRYQAHLILREYAADRFKNHPARKDTYAAHANYYARFIEKVAVGLNTSRETAVLEAIDTEIENLRNAWQYGIEMKRWDVYDALLQPLLSFFASRGLAAEGVPTFRQLADALQHDKQANTPLYWRARIRQAWLMPRVGEAEASFNFSKAAYEFFTQPGNENHVEAAHALNNMSYASMAQGDFAAARDYATQANVLIGDMADVMAWFTSMGHLGYAEYLLGNYAEARSIYESAEMVGENVAYSPVGLAYGKNNLGEILREIGEIETATQLFQEAFDIFEVSKNKRGMAFTLNNLAGVLFLQGNYADAEKMYLQGYRLNKEIGDMTGIGHSLSALGNIAMTNNDFAKAKHYFEDSLKIRRQIGDKLGIADSMTDIARIESNLNHHDVALRLMREAQKLYHDIGNKSGEGYAYAGAAIALFMLNQVDTAVDELQKAYEIGTEINNQWILAQCYLGFGLYELNHSNYDKALVQLKESLAISYKSEVMGIALFALAGIAKVYKAQGNYQQALELIALVLVYPRNFIAMVEAEAKQLMEELRHLLPPETITSTMQQSKSLVLRNVIADLLEN
jgi:predicted ATPase/lipopolysaccharide biosynthesis regulator YciM